MQVDSQEYETGMVADVIEKGYRLGDRVIRHAKVTVSRGQPEPQSRAQEVEQKGH